MPMRQVNLALLTSVSLVCAALAAAPAAQAAFASDPPGKSSTVTVTVDGVTVGIANDAKNSAGDSLSRAFGGGNFDDSGINELSAMYTARPDGASGNALAYLPAQGGVIENSCVGGGGSSEFYQRAQVTLSGLPASNTKVWAFYDPAVGSGEVVKTFPHFDENSPTPIVDDSQVAIANQRITATANLPTLCDNSTLFVNGDDSGVLVLGTGSYTRSTAGVFKSTSSGTVSFDAYVPMNGASDDSTSIFLALGLVVDVGNNGVDDTTDDVAIETWLSSEPYWSTPGPPGDVNFVVPPCNSPQATDEACVESISGVFAADGTTRQDSGYAVKMTLTGDADDLSAYVDLAPTQPIGTSGYSVPANSIAKLAISWPTDGDPYLGGQLPFGTDPGEVDFTNAVADTPILVDPATTDDTSNTNRWDIKTTGGRVVTTMIGQARTTSDAISRDTWWPQCEVDIVGGATQQDKCGEGMTGAVTSDYMVFSHVPARMHLSVAGGESNLAGGLVSTNGQSFAFGPETMSGVSFQFAVAGPSYDFNGNPRSADGFYFVCMPEDYLTAVFDATTDEAVSSFVGTRDNTPVGTTFSSGTCGDGEPGAIAALNPFGYSAPLFRLAPAAAPVVVPPAPVVYPPGAPTAVAVEIGDGSANVTWSAPEWSGSFPVTNFEISATPGGKSCLVQAPALSCQITGLTNDMPYTFAVRALNAAGWGAWSSASPEVTPVEPVVPTITISGQRGEVRGRQGVIVSGSSVGLSQGALVQPWVKLAGQSAYSQGVASISVDDSGTFIWQRRTGKKVYVYFVSADGVKSDRIILQSARAR